MNRRRNIVIVLVIGVVALMFATGWNVLASAAWPPDPMPVYSLAGAWIQIIDQDPTDEVDTIAISPEDTVTDKGFFIQTDVNMDTSRLQSDSITPWIGTYIRTGTNTWQTKWIGYTKIDTKPMPTIKWIIVIEGTWTMTSPDRVEFAAAAMIYSPDQDSDGDGLPDEGQQPVAAVPTTGYMKSL
jgi:hypothetical protein